MCHPTFASNASGTDWDTINEEGEERNHFVSLIVSNTHEYHAYLTRKIRERVHKDITSTKSYQTWGDASIILGSQVYEEEDKLEYIEAYELNVNVEDVEIAKTALDLRMDELEVSAESFANRSKRTYTDYTQKQYVGSANKQLMLPFEKGSNDSNKVISSGNVGDNKDYISDNIINKYTAILITGDILSQKKINNPKNPNYISDYAKNMVNFYSSIFKNDEDFHLWADCIVDYLYNSFITNESTKELIFNSEEVELEELIVNEWANKICQAIIDLADNKYTRYFEELLNAYIV